MTEKTRIYMAHPRHARWFINLLVDHLGKRFPNLEFINPFAENLENRKLWLETQDNGYAKFIMYTDLELIDSAHLLLAYWPYAFAATPMEIFYSSHIKDKKTAVITSSKPKHPWITAMDITKIITDDQLIKFLAEINDGDVDE